MTAATITKLIAAVITAAKSTNVLCLPAMRVTPRPGLDAGVIALINGLMMLLVNAVTIVAKAAPMTTATARSTTFPRRMKSLKPLSMVVSLGGASVAEGHRYLVSERRRRNPCRSAPRHTHYHETPPHARIFSENGEDDRVLREQDRLVGALPGGDHIHPPPRHEQRGDGCVAQPHRYGGGRPAACGPSPDEADIGEGLTGPRRAHQHPTVGRREIVHRTGRDELGRPQPEREVGGAHGAARGEVDGGDDDGRTRRSRRRRDRGDQRGDQEGDARGAAHEQHPPPPRPAEERAEPVAEARGEAGVGHDSTLGPRGVPGTTIVRSVDSRRRCGWTADWEGSGGRRARLPPTRVAAKRGAGHSAARDGERRPAITRGARRRRSDRLRVRFAGSRGSGRGGGGRARLGGGGRGLGVGLLLARPVALRLGGGAGAVGAGLRLRDRAPRPRTAVGAVETAALEHDPHGGEHLPQLAAAHGALGERWVRERLDGIEPVVALGAGVLVGGHGSSAGWHSQGESASITPEGHPVFPKVTRPAFGSSAAVTGWSCGSAGRRSTSSSSFSSITSGARAKGSERS